MIPRFEGRQNGKTWAETVADQAIPLKTVEEIKQNWAEKSDEDIIAVWSGIKDGTNQTENARNVRIAFRQMIKERGL